MPRIHRRMEEDGPCQSRGGSRKNENVVLPEPVDRDNPEYRMNHPGGRGYAIILNHATFEEPQQYPDRIHSEDEVRLMKETYLALGFDETNIHVKTDLNRNKIFKLIDTKLRDETIYNFTDKDCLSITVLSHGAKNETGAFQAYDCSVPFTDLWAAVDKIRTLAGKPKLFFIDCSRGREVDKGATVDQEVGGHQEQPQENEIVHHQVDMCNEQYYIKTYKIPSAADIFIAYSTAKGYRAYNERTLSPFIDELNYVFTQNQKKEDNEKDDLLSMMVGVTRNVAFQFHDPLNRMKQCPSCTSTLIRKVYFRGMYSGDEAGKVAG